MALHLLRGFVQWHDHNAGRDIKTIEEAEAWVDHIHEMGFNRFYTETSRRIKRADELAGGSVYFVGGERRSQALFRMPFVEVEEGYNGFSICMRPEIVRVRQDFVGKVRGWRYLEDRDAPPDLLAVEIADVDMPPEMVSQLKRDGLL